MTENDSSRTENHSTHPDPIPPREYDSAPPETSDAAKRGSAAMQGSPLSHHPRSSVMRLLGLGTELAGFTIVVMGIGYAVDSARGHETRYATALGALIGFTLGMIRFIRNVRSLNED